MTRENKLSVRKDTIFKDPSSSSSSYKARVATVLKKALELSELCGVDVCMIWYDREGKLVKTWPEKEEAKIRGMAERYSMLSEQEKNAKRTNLLGFLNKKMIRDKKKSLKSNDNRFSQRVSVLEDSLQSHLQTFQENLQRFQVPQDPTLVSSANASSLINLYHHQASLLHYPSSTAESCVSTTTTSMNHPSKFSILLYNHDNGTFTQLANSSSLPSFEQQPQIPCYQDYGHLDLLLGEQGMRGSCCNNFDLPTSTILSPSPPPPLMQTQTPNFQQFKQTQQAYDHQIPYFGRMLS